MTPLVATLAALAAAPLLVRVLHGRVGRAADRIAQVAIGLVLLLEVIPGGVRAAGVAGWIALALGLGLGVAAHRVRSGEASARVLAVGALLLHCVLDGAGMAVPGAQTLAWAVALHSVPVGLASWRLASARAGVRAAAALLLATMAATIGGFLGGSEVAGLLDGRAVGIAQCLVAGAILHVLGHLGGEIRPGPGVARPFLAFLALAILFAPDAASGSGVFGYHDLRHHHLPWRAWAGAKLAAGQLPAWCPQVGLGFPLLAEGEGGFLYPPAMLAFATLPATLALDWVVLGHWVLAAVGAYSLARASGARAGAWLAGVAYGFGGFLVSHVNYLGMQNAFAWLPWCLLGVLTRRGWLAAIAVGMMGVAGHPQAAAFGGVAAVVAAVGCRWWIGLGWLAVGAGIAAPQALATLELLPETLRAGGVDAGFASIGALPVPELVNAVLPTAFGFERPADIAETYMHRGTGYWGGGVNHWETCWYVSVPLAVAALAAGVLSRRARPWLLAAAAAIVLAMGGAAWELARHLPGLGGFRFPARWLGVAVLALAVAGAHGADALARVRGGRRARGAVAAAAALLLAYAAVGSVALQARRSEIAGWLEARFHRQVGVEPVPIVDAVTGLRFPGPDPEDPRAIPAKVARILADLDRTADPLGARVLVPVGLLLATAALLRRPRGLALVAAADLWWFGHDYNPRVPAAEIETPPAWLSPRMTAPGGDRTTVLGRHVDADLDTGVLSANLGLVHGTSDVAVPSPLSMVRLEAVLDVAGLAVGQRGQPIDRYLDNIDIARRLSLHFVVATREISELVPVYRGERVRVYRDPGSRPRLSVARCAEVATSARDALARLRDAPPGTVVIEGADSAPGCVEGEGEVRLRSYADTEVWAEASGPGWLVLADTWYPGWEAAVDGVAVPIARADVVGRAIALPPGEHEVVFRYDTRRLERALGVAAVVLLACVAIGIHASVDGGATGAGRSPAP